MAAGYFIYTTGTGTEQYPDVTSTSSDDEIYVDAYSYYNEPKDLELEIPEYWPNEDLIPPSSYNCPFTIRRRESPRQTAPVFPSTRSRAPPHYYGHSSFEVLGKHKLDRTETALTH